MQNGQRKWAAESQAKAVAVVAELQGRIDAAKEQYEVLKKCGLEREAKASVLPKLQRLEAEKLQLMNKIDEERREGAKALLMCFCSADFACESAYGFADTLNRISYGMYGKGNSFSDDICKVAKSFNRLVCVIDSERNDALSTFYADMAEECTAAASEAVSRVIDRYMDTDQGRKYF